MQPGQEAANEASKQRGRRLIAKNSMFNMLGQVAPMIVGVVTIPMIVKGLGTNAYGVLSIAFLLLGYFSIFDLGLSRATVKFVAENLHSENAHKVPELIWTSLALLAGLGCIAGGLAAAIVPVAVTHFFKMPADYVSEARRALYLLAAAMPVMMTNDALRGVLEASQRFDLVNYVKVPASVTYYLVAAAVIPFGVKVPGIVMLMIGIRLASSAAYWTLALRVIPGLRSGIRFSRAAIRPLTVFGGWVMISNFTGPIFGYLERFMIASVLSVGMLTYYSVPYDLVSKMIIFPACIVPSLFPYFSFHGRKRSEEVSQVTSRTMKYLLLVLTPIAGIFMFFSHDILRLWLNPQFANESAVTMEIIALIFFFNAFAMVPFTSVQALGRPDLKAILDVSVLPVYAGCAWWLMHHFGINGAALAKLAVTLLDLGFLYMFASRLKAFSARDLFSGPLSRAILASGGLVAAMGLIERMHLKLIVSATCGVLCILAYAGVFFVFAVDGEDRMTFGGLSQRAFALLRGRPARAAVQMSGNDVGA